MSRPVRRPVLSLLVPVLLGSALLLSCGSDKEDSAGEAGPDCARRPVLTWDNFGKPHMDKHCNGCHSVLIPLAQRQNAPVGVDFNTYSDVLEWYARIIARSTTKVLDEPSMPPGGGPSEQELAMVLEWLECEVARDKEALADQR